MRRTLIKISYLFIMELVFNTSVKWRSKWQFVDEGDYGVGVQS